MSIPATVTLLLIAAGSARARITVEARCPLDPAFAVSARATGSHGPTSLAAGYTQLELANSGNETVDAVIKLEALGARQVVSLPPQSRKQVEIDTSNERVVAVEVDGNSIWTQRVNYSRYHSMGNTPRVIVISPRPVPMPRISAQVPRGGGDSLVLVRPGDLPSKWHYYGGEHNLLVIHRGGFDSMTESQREALEQRIRYFDSTVLMSEGRADAFTGSFIEPILPVRVQDTLDFSEWSRTFNGAKDEPSALVTLKSTDGAEELLRAPSGVAFAVARKWRDGRLCTYLAFDPNAPPFREWNADMFWTSIAPVLTPSFYMHSHLLVGIANNQALFLELSPVRLVVFGVILAAGFAGLIVTSALVRGNPDNLRRRLQVPALFAVACVVIMLGIGLVQPTGAALFEVAMLHQLDDSAALRMGRIILRGQIPEPVTLERDGVSQPEVDHFTAASSVQASPPDLQLGPPAKVTVRSKAANTVYQVAAREILDLGGRVRARVVESSPGSYTVSLDNSTSHPVRRAWVVVQGSLAPLGGVAPGGSHVEDVPWSSFQTQPAPSVSRESLEWELVNLAGYSPRTASSVQQSTILQYDILLDMDVPSLAASAPCRLAILHLNEEQAQ